MRSATDVRVYLCFSYHSESIVIAKSSGMPILAMRLMRRKVNPLELRRVSNDVMFGDDREGFKDTRAWNGSVMKK